ncbi:RPM1 interacting protein 13 isoform X2 [Lathyrus oleraceus]|uniref:RPM1 interacting protein 13 isoform X2 n=1 Tax=Pisum sativum TaxID=3888 RepID=UPI0021CE20F2|nr:RPM1 interacting protein 13-like isoform X2 [Pisum sativum]
MPYCSGNTKEKKNKTMAEEKECSKSSNLSSPMAETPIRPVVCLKRKEDVKLYEETEECFILDFDPFESLDFSKLSLGNKNNTNDDDTSDISIVAEKGQVACRDYPHARHHCVKFPFTTTPHESSCENCYCYVCDSVAPCKYWTRIRTRSSDKSDSHYDAPHCDANSDWEEERNEYKRLTDKEAD